MSRKIHDVLLATDDIDAGLAISRDPSLQGCSVITRESQLYGLMIGEWHITEAASRNMSHLPKMVSYLKTRAALTESLRARGAL